MAEVSAADIYERENCVRGLVHANMIMIDLILDHNGVRDSNSMKTVFLNCLREGDLTEFQDLILLKLSEADTPLKKAQMEDMNKYHSHHVVR